MKKIRVGFFLHLTDHWLGGVNYFKNLLTIIKEQDSFNIEPVVFMAAGSNKALLKEYPEIEVIELRDFQSLSIKDIFYKIAGKFMRRNLYLEKFLKGHHIDVISHVGGVLFLKNIPTIAWIPDFQHRHLHNLFSAKEIEERDFSYEQLAKYCKCVVLSSYNAQKDFIQFLPQYADKSKILQFVVPAEDIEFNIRELRKKYQLAERFFYLPNQFWMHKNHKIVLEALKILKDRAFNCEVICSGDTNDPRNEHYFLSVKEYIEENFLENNFKILGKIPFEDVRCLLQNCVALINPSLFEGWSTTVEEAKSLGKVIILSDIEVHKEQAPKGGRYFVKNDAQGLANLLQDVWNENPREADKLKEDAKAEVLIRKKELVGKYREILEEVLNT